MNRPTDDELEAMAARLDKGDPFGGVMQRAAAMLRACKTGDAPDHAEWDAAIEAAANVAQSADTPVFKDGWTSGQDAAAISAMQSIAAAIRQLKKGQTNG